MTGPSNFAFLVEHSTLLADLGATAERLYPFDPSSCVLKLRLLAEAITRDIAARVGVALVQPTQAELLRAVDARLGMDAQVRQLFHLLRRTGNAAAHEVQHGIGYREGLEALRVARELAVWFHRTFGSNPSFQPGPFRLPDDPSQKLATLQQQLEQLRGELSDAQTAQTQQAQLTRLLEAQADQERAMARHAQEENAVYQQLAEEASQRYAALQAEFESRLNAQAQRTTQSVGNETLAGYSRRAAEAATHLQMDEATTRLVIDLQLIEAGWDADTTRLTHASGARPERGRYKAIAEWPMGCRQSADYLLFAGLTPIAVVEAKRQNIQVAGKIGQAERYARSHTPEAHLPTAWQQEGRSEPWPDGQGAHFHIPFVYSSNGRPQVKQLAEVSGTWFRDVRSPSNTARSLPGFHSPQGLLDLLQRSREAAQARLQAEPYGYLQLRDYQVRAIGAVEAALADHRRNCLLAMATGTGKTRTIIGLVYRLLKAERFKRILFLVDRTALGQQAQDAFNEAPLESNQPLSKIYNIAELGDMAAEAETRVQVATVQAMVKRLFGSDNPPPVDTYDCLIVDEAHRGYTLDQEMTEGELALRDHAQYLSSYRRVLDYFDAVRIGLTATPARHTTEIFGKPIFTYSYREAVAEDWLIDHEPPIRYQTLLSQKGIHFDKGEQVEVLHLDTGEIEVAELDDELDFQIESFNRKVINEHFNRVICEQLAQEIDPFSAEKTLIFCATDAHADMVKRLLDEAFRAVYQGDYNEAAVRKITGASDKVEQLIRRYKNDALPSIAITVDLLTTGIDVPAICHLVFMRRVKSRILYEQMIGRATRRCDDIGKTVFRIYDPVDLYAALDPVNTMQPLVKDPNVTLAQLVDELRNPASLALPGSRPERSHAHDVLDQLGQKLMRVLRTARHQAEQPTEKGAKLKARLDALEQQWGVPPEKLHQHLHSLGPQPAAEFLGQHAGLLNQLAEVRVLMGSAYGPILSGHADELVAREQSWGAYAKPEDYLDSFTRFVREQVNQSVALAVVVNRPKDLTREQLREVRLLLDANGYSEAQLKSAWRDRSQVEIAASIVGYIRQAALGEALLPFDQRVAQAMQRVYGLRTWTPVQRKWLERLAKQLTHEVVIDAAFVNRAFAEQGGQRGLDRQLGGGLTQVMDALAEHLWPQAA